MLSQLESGLSSLIEVKQPFSLLCASRRIRLAMLKLDGLLSCTKGCPNSWSGHTILKLKSGKNNSSCLVEESECACVRVPCLCFLEGLYRVDETSTVVLTRHFDLFL